MANSEFTVALEAGPNDREDFAVTDDAISRGLAERRARRRARGAQKSPIKQQVTLRLDPDILARFKAGGPGWQSRINHTLRKLGG